MRGKKMESCEKCGSQERLSLRHAWIDRDGKIISFHPINSGQLIEAEDSAFWEEVFSLSKTGYRIQ